MKSSRLLILGALLLAAGGCTTNSPTPAPVTATPAATIAAAADTQTPGGVTSDSTLVAPLAAGARPANWAQPLTLPGLPNLHKVSDQLYRGAQPEAEGIAQLKALGIRTIVNLRGFHSDRDEIDTFAIGYEHITFNTWQPERADMVRFLRIVTNPDSTPVFVHCQHGADRTGTMVALYRIAVQGWSKTEAIREMTEGGFGFHYIWSNLPQWVENLDIERLKRQAGM